MLFPKQSAREFILQCSSTCGYLCTGIRLPGASFDGLLDVIPSYDVKPQFFIGDQNNSGSESETASNVSPSNRPEIAGTAEVNSGTSDAENNRKKQVSMSKCRCNTLNYSIYIYGVTDNGGSSSSDCLADALSLYFTAQH